MKTITNAVVGSEDRSAVVGCVVDMANDGKKRIANLIKAIKRGMRKGERLYFVCDAAVGTYDYYSSYIKARTAIRHEEMLFANDGSFEKCVTVYDLEKLEEINLAGIVEILDAGVNPFEHLHYASSDYPYEWMFEMESLFPDID